MKVKFYNNIEDYIQEAEAGETQEYQINIVNRNKYIDIDCNMKARTPYTAFKKLVTALKNAGFKDYTKDLTNEFQYKEDFLECLQEETFHYPSEKVNAFYGYYIQDNEGEFYLRHFFPVEA